MSEKQMESKQNEQFSTFTIGGRLYGIEVSQVQEVVRPLAIAMIPGSPDHIRGLINLRGQVATAVGLRELFSITKAFERDFMNVVCKIDSSLIAFQVEEIGDVVEVESRQREPTPTTSPFTVKRFLHGVANLDHQLLSIINIEEIFRFLNTYGENHELAA